jgi:hypothetical protein
MTIRVWFIGLVLSLSLAVLNTFLYFRNPAPGMSPTLFMYVFPLFILHSNKQAAVPSEKG